MSSRRVLLSAPDVGELEQEYVLRALSSGWVAPAGPDLGAFEHEVAQRVGVRHAVGLSSGTAALHLALVSWGIGPGDTVVASTLTFAATANAAKYVGADLHFVDCDPFTGNIDSELLAQALAELHAGGRKVGAVIPVDMLGVPIEYDRVADVVRGFGTRLLCDAAESFGASFRGRSTGSFGDASVLSFNGNKIMTTSGGGMLLTDDQALAEHVRKLSTQAREPFAHYEHEEVGFNYRLSNILAALGRAQLTRLDAMIHRRARWRAKYEELLGRPGVRFLGAGSRGKSNDWLSAIVVDPAVAGWHATDLGHALDQAGVETRPVWKPLHQQPVFKDCTATLSGAADHIFANGLTLPSGSGMSDDDFGRIEIAIRNFLERR